MGKILKILSPITELHEVILDYAYGRYVEIGSHIGNSAIIASYRAHSVTCIDPLDEFMTDAFWRNLKAHGVSAYLLPVSSYPWPEILEGRQWDTALVDGEHSYKAVASDLRNLAPRVRDKIIVDDVNEEKHPGIAKALWDFLSETEEWRILETRGTIVVLERRDA